MSDAAVAANLNRLKVAIPATVSAQRARLPAWSTQSDLDAIAVEWTAVNGGVRPVVRLLEESSLPVGASGAAGTIPR